MRLPPIATELVYGASVWVYRDGAVAVVPIEAPNRPDYRGERP